MNHQAVAHSETTLEKIQLVRSGITLTGKHKVFGAAYRLLDPNRPSPTVTRSGFRDFIHPDEDRLCTVRELARLQTFPDSYEFRGRRCDTYASSRYVKQTQHEQLGNAVPPLLAKQVAAAIRSQLFERRNAAELATKQNLFNAIFSDLDSNYPEDDLGNKQNPLDELIYILLSRRARERQYQDMYHQLRRKYRSWTKVLSAPTEELVKVIQPLGLARQRAKAIKDVLVTIAADFGRLTLSPLRRMGYSGAYRYLRSLPGVNDKTAKCVMLYSLGLPALPVDTHTFRVSKRIGLLDEDCSLYLAGRRLEAIVPRNYRGRYHVVAVLHGRTICKPDNPLCEHCPIQGICETGRRHQPMFARTAA